MWCNTKTTNPGALIVDSKIHFCRFLRNAYNKYQQEMEHGCNLVTAMNTPPAVVARNQHANVIEISESQCDDSDEDDTHSDVTESMWDDVTDPGDDDEDSLSFNSGPGDDDGTDTGDTMPSLRVFVCVCVMWLAIRHSLSLASTPSFPFVAQDGDSEQIGLLKRGYGALTETRKPMKIAISANIENRAVVALIAGVMASAVCSSFRRICECHGCNSDHGSQQGVYRLHTTKCCVCMHNLCPDAYLWSSFSAIDDGKLTPASCPVAACD